jgi:hypothetical protein
LIDSPRSTRCRVEFAEGVHNCYASGAWKILEKRLGPAWVIDTGVDEARTATLSTFEGKLRSEGMLLVWESKESFHDDPTAENVAATVFMQTPYLVETPQGKQQAHTLSAAGHIAAARGWVKITHMSEQVPRLTKSEMQEFLSAVDKHDPRKVKPVVLLPRLSHKPVVEEPPQELLKLLTEAAALEKKRRTAEASERVFNAIDDMLQEKRFSEVDKMLELLPINQVSTNILETFVKVTIADASQLPQRKRFLTCVRTVTENREEEA